MTTPEMVREERARVAEEIAEEAERRARAPGSCATGALFGIAAFARAHSTPPEAAKPAEKDWDEYSTEGASGGLSELDQCAAEAHAALAWVQCFDKPNYPGRALRAVRELARLYAREQEENRSMRESLRWEREKGRRAGLEEAARICDSRKRHHEHYGEAIRRAAACAPLGAQEQRQGPERPVSAAQQSEGSNPPPGTTSDRQRRVYETARGLLGELLHWRLGSWPQVAKDAWNLAECFERHAEEREGGGA